MKYLILLAFLVLYPLEYSLGEFKSEFETYEQQKERQKRETPELKNQQNNPVSDSSKSNETQSHIVQRVPTRPSPRLKEAIKEAFKSREEIQRDIEFKKRMETREDAIRFLNETPILRPPVLASPDRIDFFNNYLLYSSNIKEVLVNSIQDFKNFFFLKDKKNYILPEKYPSYIPSFTGVIQAIVAIYKNVGTTSEAPICTGALISENRVLTARHCLENDFNGNKTSIIDVAGNSRDIPKSHALSDQNEIDNRITPLRIKVSGINYFYKISKITDKRDPLIKGDIETIFNNIAEVDKTLSEEHGMLELIRHILEFQTSLGILNFSKYLEVKNRKSESEPEPKISDQEYEKLSKLKSKLLKILKDETSEEYPEAISLLPPWIHSKAFSEIAETLADKRQKLTRKDKLLQVMARAYNKAKPAFYKKITDGYFSAIQNDWVILEISQETPKEFLSKLDDIPKFKYKTALQENMPLYSGGHYINNILQRHDFSYHNGSCIVTKIHDYNIFETNCSVQEGKSGSPVFQVEVKGGELHLLLVGIHNGVIPFKEKPISMFLSVKAFTQY